MISDIVQEMRQHTRCSAADAFYTPASWAELCDRLEREEARLIADRDNWRQQALTEDARANACEGLRTYLKQYADRECCRQECLSFREGRCHANYDCPIKNARRLFEKVGTK